MELTDFKEFERVYQSKTNQIIFSKHPGDLETPVSVMLKLTQNKQYSFLLESVTGGKELARYSIVGFAPDLVWEYQNGSVEIQWQDGFEKNPSLSKENCNPINSLRSLIEHSKINLPDDLPSSSAGIFGFFSYDMIRLIEDLPNVNPDEIKTPDSLFIRPSIVAVIDGVKREVTLACPIWYNSNLTAKEAYESGKKRLKNATRKLEEASVQYKPSKKTPPVEINFVSNTTKEEYEANVEKAIEYIRSGEALQILPSQRWAQKFELQPFALYRALRQTNPSPFMFYFNFGEFHVIGASPEILVRVSKNQIIVRPIAGTRSRGSNAKEDDVLAKELLHDEKELAEHLMLLDLGRNDVGRVAKIGSVKPTDQFIIEKYSHVMHIVSNVVGELRSDEDALSALFAGFPAGTVCGAPKVRAMEIIDELEKTKRGIYSGGVGYFSCNSDMDMCIALRTAVIKDDVLYVQAGGGVVFDSDPTFEWQESLDKTKAIRKATENAHKFQLEFME